MLILSRKKDQAIIIDGEIKITILEIDQNRVQVGIKAPRSISIYREEVLREIQQENRLALYDQKTINVDFTKIMKKREKGGDRGEKGK